MYHRTWMLKYAPGLRFEADKGKGGGPAGDGNEPGTQDETDPEKEKGPADGKKFTQAELDAIIADRLSREKKNQEAATEKARKKAEEDALLKNQEFQKLAEERGKRIAELEPLGDQIKSATETADRYKGALEKYLETEKKGLPKHVLTLLDKLDPVEQIEYIAANREELGKPKGPDGVPASPNPKERKLSEDDQKSARNEQASLYRS